MKYAIASLVVDMQPEGKTLLTRAEPYLTDSGEKADIKVNIDRIRLLSIHQKNPHLTYDDCEYIYTGEVFYKALLGFGGLLLHASAVVLDGEAYLFSARSGGGKSTHASLWLRLFGSRAYIINDDKPALRLIDNTFYVMGTPWCGKTDLNKNASVPLKAVTFLEKGTENRIKRLSTAEALPLFFEQTLRPAEDVDKLSFLLDKLLSVIPFYRLTCDISFNAVRCAYNAMRLL